MIHAVDRNHFFGPATAATIDALSELSAPSRSLPPTPLVLNPRLLELIVCKVLVETKGIRDLRAKTFSTVTPRCLLNSLLEVVTCDPFAKAIYFHIAVKTLHEQSALP